MKNPVSSYYIKVNHTKIHYLMAGSGETILFLHGFPTSSYLYRDVLKGISDNFCGIAIDLPGYGKSDKPLNVSYSFRFYERIISEFLDELKVERVSLAVHDFGGPLGLYWMANNKHRVKRLILFNTIVYPKFSWSIKLFALSLHIPWLKYWITGPNGIKMALKKGTYQKYKLSEETITAYQDPFRDIRNREVLIKTVQNLSPKGFQEIAKELPNFKGPVLVLYGKNDAFLSDISDTFQKVVQDLPQTRVHVFDYCGHFLQEEEPYEISELIQAFMKEEIRKA